MLTISSEKRSIYSLFSEKEDTKGFGYPGSTNNKNNKNNKKML